MPLRVIKHLYREIGPGLSQGDVVLTSISLDVDKLEESKGQLPEPPISFKREPLETIRISKDFRSFASPAGHVVERGNYTNEQTLAFLDGESIARLETPKLKNFSLIDPREHRWITEVIAHGYHLPQLHFLGSKALSLHKGGVRVSSEGLSYLYPNSMGYFGRDIDAELAKPKLRLVDPLEIFRSYFQEAGYGYIGLSDKGRYAQETTRKFGSLDKVGRFFSEGRNLDLFDKFLMERSACDEETGEVVYIKGSKRVYLDFQAIESTLRSRDEAISLLDELVFRRVLHRGFIFQCKRCSNTDWYGVEEITDAFTCKRCGTEAQYRYENWKSPEEPKWYYKLDEVVFQGYRNNMHVPILTLRKLKSDSTSFLYVHELELRSDESQEKSEIEIDVCCIPDGQIVIGEGKTSKIPLRDVEKYSSLVQRLPRHPDKVVFSTLEQDLSRDVKTRISSLRNSVLFLQGDLMSD